MRQRVKPSKTVSKIQFFVGFFFLIFGMGFLVTAISQEILPMALFAVVWLGMVCVNMVIAFKNGFTDKGVSLYDVESDDMPDYERKLKSLERMLKEGLITKMEYDEKRQEIMDREWS